MPEQVLELFGQSAERSGHNEINEIVGNSRIQWRVVLMSRLE